MNYAYGIKQLCIYNQSPELIDRLFTDYERTMERFGRVNPNDYEIADYGLIEEDSPQAACETLFVAYNADERPHGYRGRSMSVSDIIVLTDVNTGERSSWFCDSIGFKKLEEVNK